MKTHKPTPVITGDVRTVRPGERVTYHRPRRPVEIVRTGEIAPSPPMQRPSPATFGRQPDGRRLAFRRDQLNQLLWSALSFGGVGGVEIVIPVERSEPWMLAALHSWVQQARGHTERELFVIDDRHTTRVQYASDTVRPLVTVYWRGR